MVTRVGASSRAIHFNNGTYGSGSTLALPIVALTLKKVQGNDTLSRQLMTRFPDLSPELAGAFDCPDFKEKNIVDKFLNIFHKKKNYPDTGDNNVRQKKRGFFRRLFGK
jgi:penicillin-binding protein 1A